MTNVFHLRITADRTKCVSITDLFIEKFKPTLYIVAYEEKGDNKHLHAHMEYEIVPKKQTVSDFFRKHSLTGKYYHKNAEKEHNNKLYVLKDLDLIKTSLSEEDIEELVSQVEVIKKDMKADVRQKLRIRIKERLLKRIEDDAIYENTDEFLNMNELDKSIYIGSFRYHYTYGLIRREICQIYVDEWDKEPPFSSRIQQYAMYIILKEGCEGCKQRLYSEIGYTIL